jgi:hypothetical protein
MHTVFSLETLKRRDYMKVLGVGGKIIFNWILGKYGEKLWTGSVCLRIGTIGGLL